MLQRLPSLNALRAFEAAARHLSLTKAAAELNVTPAAVSHQLKALEADLGLTLLRRAGATFVPSDAALAGLPDLRAAFDGLAQGVRKIRDHAGGGPLTLSVNPSFASTWLVPRLDHFKAAHPEIDVRLDASTDLVDFARDGIDAAVRYGAGDYPGTQTIRLFRESFFPVCSPALLDGPHPLRAPADLKWHTLIHVDWTSRTGEWPDWHMWLSAAGVTGVDHTRGTRFMQSNLALQAAVAGQGVALGSTALVADHLAAGRLVWPFELCLPTDFGCYFVCPQETAGLPKVAAFRDWLLAEVAHQGEAGGEGAMEPALA